jgi:anti-sigma regulatory factor (Ser/Thr protein kinase)
VEVSRFSPALHLRVGDSSNVGEARRAAVAAAIANRMGETDAGNVAIVATELATNLWRYAPGGLLSIQWITTECGEALEIVASDQGTGVENIERCIADGYSTGGTAGTGLGAVKRLSSEFDAYSLPGRGSVFVSRIARSGQPVAPRFNLQWAGFSKPVRGEVENGDAWQVSIDGDRARFFVVDGLGHGPTAAVAALTAVRSFQSHRDMRPQPFLEATHRELSGTRGAAAAFLQLEPSSGAVSYAGIGNISSCLIGSHGQKGMMSHNGTLGGNVRKIQAFDYAWPVGGILVMHSDGIKTRWSLADYPGLVERHPAIVAATLARDFSRGNDDMTVLVARCERRQ